MIPIHARKSIQIHATNACPNCTRLIGHHEKAFLMDLDQYGQSEKS